MTEIGDRIRVIRLDDPSDLIPPGTTGTVTGENVIRGRDLEGNPTENITCLYVVWDVGPYGLTSTISWGDDEWEEVGGIEELLERTDSDLASLRSAARLVVDAEYRREQWGPDTEATFGRALAGLREAIEGEGKS